MATKKKISIDGITASVISGTNNVYFRGIGTASIKGDSISVMGKSGAIYTFDSNANALFTADKSSVSLIGNADFDATENSTYKKNIMTLLYLFFQTICNGVKKILK